MKKEGGLLLNRDLNQTDFRSVCLVTLKLNPLVEYYESLGNEISNDSDVSLSVSLLSINKLENLIFLNIFEIFKR